MPSFKVLSNEAKTILDKQLEKLREKVVSAKGLTPSETNALLSITKWLYDMAILEDAQIGAIEDPRDRLTAQRKRINHDYYFKKKIEENEHECSSEGRTTEETKTEDPREEPISNTTDTKDSI